MFGLYDKYVLPKVCNCCMNTKPVNYQRKKIVPNAKGRVLEIGIGSGSNIPFYDKNKVTKVIGIDPSKELNAMAKKMANKNNIDVEIIESSAEVIPLPDKSVDTVLVTYTMCTVPDVMSANIEMKRVLKNDGEMLFCEHGIADNSKTIALQNRLNSIWGIFFGGCNLNRDIPKLITESGFTIKSLEKMYLPGTPKFIGYNYWGSATK